MTAQQLRDLADGLPVGWTVRRSPVDDALLLEADGEPIAQILAGFDVARYLLACDPHRLLPLLAP